MISSVSSCERAATLPRREGGACGPRDPAAVQLRLFTAFRLGEPHVGVGIVAGDDRRWPRRRCRSGGATHDHWALRDLSIACATTKACRPTRGNWWIICGPSAARSPERGH